MFAMTSPQSQGVQNRLVERDVGGAVADEIGVPEELRLDVREDPTVGDEVQVRVVVADASG